MSSPYDFYEPVTDYLKLAQFGMPSALSQNMDILDDAISDLNNAVQSIYLTGLPSIVDLGTF